MRLATLRLKPYHLPFRQTWQSAAGGMTTREGWLLCLQDREGGTGGYGDCAPLPAIGTETLAESAQVLARWQQELPELDAETALERLNDPKTFDTPAARAAMECALLDLLARRNRRSLNASIRGCDCRSSIKVNATLGGLSRDTASVLESAMGAGFQVCKLKVGLGPVAEEISHITALARNLPTGVTLRLDANRAWTEPEARRWVEALAGLPIDSLEEPLARPSAAAWADLQSRCTFPLALDESLADLPPHALFDGTIHRLILKLPRLGGFLPAVTLAQRFAASGGDCIVTSALESTCGVLAAAHLAAGLGGNLAHGLATSEWLTEDLGPPPPVIAGYLTLPSGPGLGFSPAP